MYFLDSIRPWFRLQPVVGPLHYSPFCNSAFYDGILRCSVRLHSGNRRPWLPHYGWFVRIYILASWRRWSSIDCLPHPGMAKTSACVKLPSRIVHSLVPVSLKCGLSPSSQLRYFMRRPYLVPRYNSVLSWNLSTTLVNTTTFLGPSFPTSSDVLPKTSCQPEVS